MSTRRVARGSAMLAGVGLVLIGPFHVIQGLPSLQRAVSRGEIAERLAGPMIVNWLFSGAAMLLLGILVLVAAWDLERAGRFGRYVIVLTGLVFMGVAIGGYALHRRPTVFVFAVLGAMLCAPFLIPPRSS